jgi:hypothetical protein
MPGTSTLVKLWIDYGWIDFGFCLAHPFWASGAPFQLFSVSWTQSSCGGYLAGGQQQLF